MAVAVVFVFPKLGMTDYHAVNARLGMDTTSPSSDWPAGMLSHAAGTRDGGGLVVSEIWESREAEERFMRERLGPAIQAAGLTDTPQMTWADLTVYTVPQGAAAAT